MTRGDMGRGGHDVLPHCETGGVTEPRVNLEGLPLKYLCFFCFRIQATGLNRVVACRAITITLALGLTPLFDANRQQSSQTKFPNSMRNTFSMSLRCVIFTKATIASQSMNTTWTHGENLSLLFTVTNSLSFDVFTQFPEFSLTGKLETHFQGFP